MATRRGSIRTPALISCAHLRHSRDRSGGRCLPPCPGQSGRLPLPARSEWWSRDVRRSRCRRQQPSSTDISTASWQLTAPRLASASRSALKVIPVVPPAITFTSRCSRMDVPSTPVRTCRPGTRIRMTKRGCAAGVRHLRDLVRNGPSPLPYAGLCLAAGGFSGRGAPNEFVEDSLLPCFSAR